MSDEEEIGPQLDESLDLAGENLRPPDELDLDQDRADRMAGASPEDHAATKDEDNATTEQFIYTAEDGTEIQGTVEEIAQKLAENRVEARVAEELAKAQPSQQTQTQDTQTGQEAALPYEIRPLELEKVGTIFQTMLEGGDSDLKIGGPESVGPQLQEFTFQSLAQDPRFYDLISRVIHVVVDEREAGAKAQNSFQEFTGGGKEQDAEITAFMKENPWAANKEMAVMGLQLAKQRKEIEDLKASTKEAEAKGKKDGAKETITNLKAKGILRRIAGGKGGSTSTNNRSPQAPRTENQRISDMANHITAMRQGSAR